MSDPLVTLGTVGSAAEAELAKNCLEIEGIPAYVMGGETADMLWHLGPAMGGVKLQVAESDLPRARRVLAARLDAFGSQEIDDYGLDTRPTTTRARISQAVAANDEDMVEPEKDAIAQRAWRAAIIGVLVCPPLLNLLSLWMLLQLSGAEGQLSDGSRWKVAAALIVDALVLGAVFLFGLSMGALGNMRL